VISVWDVDSIYKVPRMLHAQGLDELICAKLQLHTKPANLARWDKLVEEVEHPKHEVTIAMCGKYVELSDSYKSLNEALRHAGIHNHARVKIESIDSEDITAEQRLEPGPLRRDPRARRLRQARRRGQDPGRPVRAREEDPLPRASASACRSRRSSTRGHKAGLAGANSTEFDPLAEHPVIALIDEWEDRDGSVQKRTAQSDLGGTMRLGAQSSDVKPGTLAHEIYGNVVNERHRHRYEANENYLDRLTGSGPRDLGDHPARQADRDRRAAEERASLVHRRAVPPRVQVDAVGRPSALQVVHPCRPGTPGGAQRKGRRMNLCGFDAGLEHPLFLIAGPCVVESEQLQIEVAGHLKEITSVARRELHLQVELRQGNRSSGTSFRGPGMERGLEILAKVKKAARRARDHRRASRRGDRRGGGRSSTPCRRPPSSAARPTSSAPSRRAAGPSTSRRASSSRRTT
jgi:hypothetical protein